MGNDSNSPFDKVFDGGAVEGLPIWSKGKSAVEATDIVDFGVAVKGLAVDVGLAIVDPIGFLVSNGLAFLIDWIQPLEDALGLVTGNPKRIGEDATKWEEVAKELGEIAKALSSAVRTDLTTWQGPAADSARENLGKFAESIDGIGGDVNGISAILGISITLMEIAQQIILAIISEFVTWLVLTWIAALAAAAPTLGGSTAAAGAATAGEGAIALTRTARAIQKISQVLAKLRMIMQKIAPAIMRHYERMGRMAAPLKTGLEKIGVGVRGTTPAIFNHRQNVDAAVVGAGEAAIVGGYKAVKGLGGYATSYQSNSDLEDGLAGI